MNTLKLKIMIRAFRIRIKNGESFEDIATDYPALTADDLEDIREALNENRGYGDGSINNTTEKSNCL